MLQRCAKSAKKCLLFFFEYIILQSHAIMCLHLRDRPHGQAADDEPSSRTDKAHGRYPKEYIIRPYTILSWLVAFGKWKVFKRLAIRSRVKRRKAEHIIIEYSLAILDIAFTLWRLFIANSQRRRVPWRVPDSFNNAKYLVGAFIKFFACKGNARWEGAERLRKFSEGAWTSRRVWCVCVRTPQKPR